MFELLRLVTENLEANKFLDFVIEGISTTGYIFLNKKTLSIKHSWNVKNKFLPGKFNFAVLK